MDLKREQEGIYVAMVLSRDALENLIARSPEPLKQSFTEVREAVEHVIRLLEREIDPRDISIFDR